MRLRLLGHATFVLGAVIVGCSGASGTELFAQPASSELPNEPEDESPSASTPESSPPTSGSSLAGGHGSSGGAPSGGASSGGASSGGASSGGASSSGSPDKVPPPAAGTILCGPVGPGGAKKTCQAKTEVCCVGWGGTEFECEAAGGLACVARTSIACDDGSDCPTGQICCGRRGENSGYSRVECRATCKDGPGFRAVQFCDPNAAKDECAPSGKQCVPSQIMPGYHVCQG